MSATYQRFYRERACPICGGHPGLPRGRGVRCMGYQNGNYARCSREEHAGSLPLNDDGTYSHRLTGPCHCGRTHDAANAPPRETLAASEPPARVLRTRRWEHGHVDGESIEHVREDLSNGEKRVWWERGRSSSLRGLRVADLPLYGVSGLNGAQDVIVVEGEPATDAGKDLHIPVVGTVTGAKSAPSDDSLRPMLDKTVYLWPDNDQDGECHMAKVAERLRALGHPPEKIRRIVWIDAPPKGDLADWRVTNPTSGNLRQLLAQAPPWEARAPTTGTAPSATPGASRLVVSSLADVVSQPVVWSWYRWLPQGKFHLFGGYAGDGKSTLLAALAAAGSRAGEWPDGTYAPRVMRTLFLLGEDSAADTLRPRLALHDADMDQIFVTQAVLDENGRERFFNIGKHLDLLEAEIAERGIDWVVVDPLTTIMSGTDRNAEGDTRDALTPLIKLAERRNVTITGVAHVGKSGDARRAAQKILGATAFHALARVVWMIAPDEEGRRVLGVVKSNLATKPPSLAWSRQEDGPIVWEGVSDRDVEDLLTSGPKASPRADAEGFLREFLSRGAKPSVQVLEAAKVQSISDITLRRAAEAISVKKWKASGTNGCWYWSLPDGQRRHAEPSTEAAESNLLTPKDSQVSKLSKSPAGKLLDPAEGEHLHEMTPVLLNGQPTLVENVMEGDQLARPEPLGSEQVTSLGDEYVRADAWSQARREWL